MQENKEYCDSQDFQIAFVAQPPTIYEGGFQLWKCKQCGFEFSQHPISDEKPVFPTYHPKPIPTLLFTVSEEQKARLKEMVDKELQDIRCCNRIIVNPPEFTIEFGEE